MDKRGLTKGAFRDLYTGPSTQAIALLKRGFTVTGTDISESGIKKAKKLSNTVDFNENNGFHS
ncbi:MAG: class I SAM-dependent methyltransferase [Proteobacteria bacterium]|nr:class I SAM-dependent methyltransferase [Pseudomonadota bacterium]